MRKSKCVILIYKCQINDPPKSFLLQTIFLAVPVFLRYRRDDRLSSKGMMMDIIGNCLVPHQFCQRLQVGGKLVGVSVL